jgi:hypothetical protein
MTGDRPNTPAWPFDRIPFPSGHTAANYRPTLSKLVPEAREPTGFFSGPGIVSRCNRSDWMITDAQSMRNVHGYHALLPEHNSSIMPLTRVNRTLTNPFGQPLKPISEFLSSV